jgi:hypothetical protein
VIPLPSNHISIGGGLTISDDGMALTKLPQIAEKTLDFAENSHILKRFLNIT